MRWGCDTEAARSRTPARRGTYGWRVARIARLPPSTHSARWPDEPCGDPAAEVARAVAVALRSALDGRSQRVVGHICGVDHTTIGAVLNGTTWADLATIARLEAGLDAQLWPLRDQAGTRS